MNARQYPLAKATAACLSVAIGCMAATSAWASGIPVVDAGHIAKQIFEFEKQIKRFEDMKAEWESKLSINPLEREETSMPKIGDKLKLRDDDEGVEQRCDRDGGGGFGLGDIFSVSFNPEGNLREEQKKLCALQVRLENRKWNDNVLVIRAMELKEERAREAADSRSGGDTEGQANTKKGDVDVTQNDLINIVNAGQERIAVWDKMISSAAQMQSMVAEKLLAGQKPSGFVASVAEDLVQGAVLKAALEVGTGDCGDELGVRCD